MNRKYDIVAVCQYKNVEDSLHITIIILPNFMQISNKVIILKAKENL
jgi:hypothetical protein